MKLSLSIALVAASVFATAVEGRADDMPFAVVAAGDGFTNRLSRADAGWTDGTVSVAIDGDGRVSVRSPDKGLSSVTLSWTREWPRGAKFLNDAWERSYGELEWQALAGDDVFSPWYFLAAADGKTSGIGVETQPNAMACWKLGKDGYSLVLDVRAGGRPVRLGDRELRACRIVRSESTAGESAWRFGRRFCRTMCPKPKLPKAPVYGYNDWYCAYGKNTATNFLADAEYVVGCAKGCENPPYVVMDDGWQKNSPPVVGESGRGPWDAAGPNFGMEMPEFCRAITALGAKPGLWYRPIRAWDELPEDQKLLANGKYLDPTVPSVRARIVADMKRFREWGFKLVKIDFLSFDISQLWPCDPHPFPELFIQDDRAWGDDTRTTAEVMLDLYHAMKDAAGDDVVIIGCNALNHLAAGVFELQRTGNDTSGRDWSWTRKNGVNTLAMRSIQDGAFFKIDADCVGLASEGVVPWTLNRQWMELLGKSGTPMFVSWRRDLATPEVRKTISEAFRLASIDREAAEPLDWFETRQPRRWRFADGTAAYYEWSARSAGRISLDGRWDFAFEEKATLASANADFEATAKVAVPGCFDLMPEWYARRGLAHYRRTFSLPDPVEDAWLVVRGMGLQARFFLDGREVAQSKLPYSTLEIPLGALAAGEHVLVAALDNNLDGSKELVFKPNYDFFLSGGFYHGVELSFDNRRLFVRTRDYRRGIVEIEAVNFAEGDFDATLLFDGRNEVAAKFKNGRATVKVPDFKLWSPEAPSLHTVAIKPTTNHCQLTANPYQLSTRFGIREFAAHDNALWLNGEKVWLKGVNRHEAHPEEGYATSMQTMLRDIEIMKSLGCNFVRGAHYPQRKEFLDLCDERGLLVWEESLGWGNVKDLDDPVFMASQVEQTRMMVRASINHPSVVVSAFLNEFGSDRESGRVLAEKLIETIRAEDSGHLVSFAANGTIDDICSSNVDFITFNYYPAWHSDMGRGTTPESLDAAIREGLEKSVRRLRAAYGGEKPIVVGESGCYSLFGSHDPMGAQWSEEFQSEYMDCWLKAAMASPDISGFTVWQLCDTRTFFRGGGDIRTKPMGYNMAGLFDAHRREKLAAATVRRHYAKSPSAGASVKPFPEFAALRAVTQGPHDHFLANYFAINAWSPDNRYMLALETDIRDRLPDGAPCTVGLVDMEDGNRFVPVMETRTWNFQEAAMAHWLPNEKDTFVVNDLRDGKFVAVVRNWRTGAERIIPHPVSAVSEDGTWALSINYARLYLARPDYGYAGEGQDPRRGFVFPEDDGLWRVDLKTGEAKLLVSCAALRDMVPQVPDTGLSYICHTVISKDMKHVYFLSRSVSQSMEGVKKFKGVNWHTTAFTCNADGSGVRRCFPDGWGSSHFNWKPALSERDARTMIVTCNWQNKVYTHVEFTVGDEEKARQVGGDAMNFDGHCIYTPDGEFISGDGYWDDKFYRHWKMVRLADNAVKDIGDFYVPEAYRDVYCRCDLHPRWRADGRQIAFNSVHEGSRQVYVMDVADNSPASPSTSWFQEARFGLFVHWGIYSIPARGEWIYARHPWKKGEYEALAKTWNPTNYNPREWAKLAKRAGMKYAVFTTRHHDGFCMFDSHFTDYKITNTPYGKDAVREYVDAFRAEGLKVGFYHSLPDWTHPGYSDPESPDGIQGRPLHTPTPEEYAAFKELVANHVRQLMTEYGKIDLLFLDYTSKFKQECDYFDRERLLKIAYECQPGIIVNDRLSFWKDNVRDFDYYTPEICVPSEPLRVKGREVSWETCATINDSWGYRAADNNWKTPEALVAGLVGCVSRNGNLLLNVGPMADGSIPTPAVERLAALGDWYAVNGESILGCGKSDFTPPFGCAYTQKGKALYCHFLQQPLGDVILPELKGRIANATLLRTGETVECVDQWGFELLKKDDQRIRPKGIAPSDVVKIVLSKE